MSLKFNSLLILVLVPTLILKLLFTLFILSLNLLIPLNLNWCFSLLTFPILNPYGITEFDAVTFVGSIEHVGWKNYEILFRKLNALLKPEGKILCHTIGSYQPLPVADPYIMTKIFPDSQLAVGSKITRAAEATGFKLTDWHNLETGIHSYAKTLRCWLHNFQTNWETIKPFMPREDKEAFKREWEFYLMLCIGGFEADNFINVGHYLWQKINNPNPGILVR